MIIWVSVHVKKAFWKVLNVWIPIFHCYMGTRPHAGLVYRSVLVKWPFTCSFTLFYWQLPELNNWFFILKICMDCFIGLWTILLPWNYMYLKLQLIFTCSHTAKNWFGNVKLVNKMSLGAGVNPHKPAALGMAAGQKALSLGLPCPNWNLRHVKWKSNLQVHELHVVNLMWGKVNAVLSYNFNLIVCRSNTVQEGSRELGWQIIGEGVERLLSSLRKFSSLTKEMSAHKRTDVLTDGLLNYDQHLFFEFCNV